MLVQAQDIVQPERRLEQYDCASVYVLAYPVLRTELAKVKIRAGQETTLVPLPLDVFVTPLPVIRIRKSEVQAILSAACAILVLIALFLLPRICLRIRFLSRIAGPYLRYYCIFVVIAAMCIILYVVIITHARLSVLFLSFVGFLEVLIIVTQKISTDVCTVILVAALYFFRSRLAALFGVDGQQLIRAEWRDVVTCFSLSRFDVIELSLWKVEDLQPSWGTSRTVFCQIFQGYNEPMNTRPIDIGRDGRSFVQKESFQFNYDPEDDQTKMSIIIRKQEVLSNAIAGNIAPITGAITGAAASVFMPGGMQVGALAGGAAAAGAASSLCEEIGRLDISSTMINRYLDASRRQFSPGNQHTMTTPGRDWGNSSEFHVLHLIPQGRIFFRFRQLSSAEV